jgi:hypothetical protein
VGVDPGARRAGDALNGQRPHIRVTAVDMATGDTDEAVIWDDYVLICAGSCYRAEVQVGIDGTHVITVKGVKRKSGGLD